MCVGASSLPKSCPLHVVCDDGRPRANNLSAAWSSTSPGISISRGPSVHNRAARTGRSKPAISTSVSGTGYVTGYHTFVVDERDPLGDGFLLR